MVTKEGGIVDPLDRQTVSLTKNMMYALAVSKGSLSRKPWASVIVQGEDQYYVLYKQVLHKKDKNDICHIEYSPPCDGGQFVIPDVCISK